MLKAVRASIGFMSPRERYKWYFLTCIRAFLSVLDLIGILAIGFVVTSMAIFLTSGSNPNRILEFVGLEIPAVTSQSLPWVGVAILFTFLAKALFSIVLTKRTAYLVAKIEARAAKEIAERVFSGDLAQARLRSPDEMTYSIQFGSPAAFNQLLNLASTVVAEGALFLVVSLGFFLVNPIATVAAITYFAIIAIVIQYFVGTLMARAGLKGAEATIRASKAVGDLISVFRELSVLGMRHAYIDRIYKSRIAAADSSAAQTYLNGMPRYIIEAALLIGVAGFILSQALTGDIVSSAATIGVFLSGGFRLTAAMLPFQSAMLSIKGIIPAAQTAQEILGMSRIHPADLSPLVGQSLDTHFKSKPVGVKFASVDFSYANASHQTLSDLSFTISPGEQVAFIGSSGAGKSTIADLMCGVLKPQAGRVSLWFPEERADSASLGAVSYVPQSPGLVSGTVAENVALGVEKSKIDEEKVLDSLSKAHLIEYIQGLPEGIYTDLGKHKESLSGGQIQRLGLARALFSNPGLLLMDEATSSLDADSEFEIARALEDMRGNVTIVLIAHRLNTVQHADKVYLIESGRVKDQGTFQDLLSRNPTVERLVKLMKVDNS